jgi:hypothetical protein
VCTLVTSVSGGGGNDRPSSTTTTADIEDDVASALILMHLERLTIPKFKALSLAIRLPKSMELPNVQAETL